MENLPTVIGYVVTGLVIGAYVPRICWNNVGAKQLRESRRVFYVGFTRAKAEVHMVFSAQSPSRFVAEVQARLEEGDAS